VALLPELRQINDDSYPFRAQHQQISSFLRAKGIQVIDLINGLKDHGAESTLWVAPADDHPNGKANALIDKFEVINAGIGNYNTVQEVAYYQSFTKAFDPDLVILIFFINDPEPVQAGRKGFLIDRSYLAAFATSRFDMFLRRFGKRPDWKTI